MLNLSLVFGLLSSGLMLCTDDSPAVSLSDNEAGWTHAAPRDDAAPSFAFQPKGGLNQSGSLLTTSESIPGPATKYFGKLAKQHDLYIVAGLVEREQHRIFNVAVLIGPEGNVVGKYRKVALPRTEIDAGVEPGDDYPVFETRFGKVGMMVCYDGFFPEVARELSNRGAEVIAFPVWGCNPLLASARACENHVYVVSSTYTDISSSWMITAIFGRDGRPIAKAKDWGDVVISEVDLGQPAIWHSLGDFHAEILRHRPPVTPTVP